MKTLAVMYAVEIGRRLKEAKSMLPHGEWGTWLKNEVEFSQSTANNFMKIFDEYGSSQITIFGAIPNSQTLGNLPYSKALKLIAIPENEREEFVKEHNIENISTREMDKLIKERDEALKRAEASAEIEGKLNKALQDLESAEKASQDAEEIKKKAEQEIQELNAELKKSQQACQSLQEKFEKAQGSPQVSEEQLKEIEERIQKEAKKEAQEKLKKKIEAADKKLESAAEEVRKAELIAEKAREEAEKLKVQIQLASPEMTEFKTLFGQVQKTFQALEEIIDKLDNSNKDNAVKCKSALEALLTAQIKLIKEKG